MKTHILHDFLNYLETIRGLSPNTVKEYRYDISNLLRFLLLRFRGIAIDDTSMASISPEEITADEIRSITLVDIYAYLSYLDKVKSNSATSRLRKVSAIRTFFNYLYKIANIVEVNPAEKLDSPKGAKRHPVYLTLDESLHLLETVAKTKNEVFRKRDLCIVTLFLNCGLRLAELTSIDVDKVQKDTFTVVGKGNKERTIYINEACRTALDEYLAVRPVVENEPALFLSMRKNRMSPRSVQHMIEKHFREAGFDTTLYSVHKLRHTAATLMYKYGGVDIRKLQQILGHTSIATTQIYTHVDEEGLRQAVESNPLNTRHREKTRQVQDKK